MQTLENATFRDTPFIPRDIAIERSDDGTIFMRSRIPLELREATLPAYLRRQSEAKPDAVWISGRANEGADWRTISFSEARRKVDSLTQALLDLDIREKGPLAILSGNSIEHALITYAAYQASIPIVPLTPTYALQANAAKKLRERLSIVKPGAYFVQKGEQYAPALEALEPSVPVIVVEDFRAGRNDLHFDDLIKTPVGQAVEEAYASIDPNAPARYMFTSGSSGAPKAVIQSQRNIIVAVESNLTSFGQTGGKGVTRLDWMPWSHVTGSAVLAATLISGGTFYIDDGKPTQEDFSRTIENLRHVSPTNYFSMPAGYVMLADALERDPDLAKSFFANLLTIGYGGARMPDDVARRMQVLAVQYTGYKIPIVCGYGSTETAPGGALVYWPTERVGLIGLPHPGYELKLVPIDNERYEVRVRSEAVALGYLGLPEKTAEMLDEDGFYSMGDAASFLSPDDPLQGLVFAGRISEEFKLVTGTFVRAGELHDLLMEATAPLLQHIVICGEGEEYVAILAWLNLNAARNFCGQQAAPLESLNANKKLRQHIAQAINAYNENNSASSRKVRRVLLLNELPSSDGGELADKGSVRPDAVRRRRIAQVRKLFSANPSDEVILVDNA